MRMSKTIKLLNALGSGENVAISKLKKITGLRNIYSTVHRLRQGDTYNPPLEIYTNQRKAGNHKVVNYYRWAV